jgi:hypothetical protein
MLLSLNIETRGEINREKVKKVGQRRKDERTKENMKLKCSQVRKNMC